MALFAWICSTGAALPGAGAAADNPAAAQELQQVVVIGNAPLPGLGLPLNQIPANVQTAGSEEMERQQTLSLADYLNNNFSGISVSESADNPFQLDINYHGFTASPLLGTPEGLSVYVDGVRVNESFGDTVNWDLIPESAISTVTLMSGSNPVFGLNTLGGALSVHTKSGHDNSGHRARSLRRLLRPALFPGTDRRRSGSVRLLSVPPLISTRLAGATAPTPGFTRASAKWAGRTEQTDIDLSYTYADTSLFGNGAAPLSMLDFRRETSYTPDFTHNRLRLREPHRHAVPDFAPAVGWESIRSAPHHGQQQWQYQRQLHGGQLRGTADRLQRRRRQTEPTIAYCANGQTAEFALDPAYSRIRRAAHRFSGRLRHGRTKPSSAPTMSDSRDTFAQVFRYGTLAPDRTLIYESNPLNSETVISLSGSNKILGGYLTDTLSPSELLHFTVSVRYNRNTETLGGYSVDTDVGDVGSGFDQPSPLAADHTFSQHQSRLRFHGDAHRGLDLLCQLQRGEPGTDGD